MQTLVITCDNCGDAIPDSTQRLMVDLGQVGHNHTQHDLCLNCIHRLTVALPNLKLPKSWQER